MRRRLYRSWGVSNSLEWFADACSRLVFLALVFCVLGIFRETSRRFPCVTTALELLTKHDITPEVLIESTSFLHNSISAY